MNIPELNSSAKYIQKNIKCQECKKTYKLQNIQVLATGETEGLFELNCEKCKNKTVVSVGITTSETKQTISEHRGIQNKTVSKDDILDIKNFLDTFDGNFKKIFSKKK